MRTGVNQVRKLKNKFDETSKSFQKEVNKMRDDVDEVMRKVDQREEDFSNVSVIISDIDKAFAQKTSITNKKDMAFLWGATALQCMRWMLLSSFDKETLTPNATDRKDACIEGRKDRTKTGKQLDASGENRISAKFVDCNQIMVLPVPYDAMLGTEDIVIKGVTEKGKNLYGGNHHSATWGHDPIVGHIIGTANILTRSITFRNGTFTTRNVEILSGRKQIVTHNPYSFVQMGIDVKDTLCEDNNRLAVAHLKQVLHMQSDKYTKDGLPIPLLPAGVQQKLLKKKWNSKELENILHSSGKGIALQFLVSALLNTSVGILHGFCYSENQDENLDLYAVRTKKIISVSNTLSSAINIAAITGGSIGGILSENPELVKESIAHVDIGGYIETLHRISTCRKLQESIRREFLEKELYNRLCSERYSFLEEAHYEQEKSVQ